MTVAELNMFPGDTLEQKLAAIPGFTVEQLEQALLGVAVGLAPRKIMAYYSPEYSVEQMEQGRLGFQQNLSTFQVDIYYHTKYSAQEMREAREMLVNGAPENKVFEMLRGGSATLLSPNVFTTAVRDAERAKQNEQMIKACGYTSARQGGLRLSGTYLDAIRESLGDKSDGWDGSTSHFASNMLGVRIEPDKDERFADERFDNRWNPRKDRYEIEEEEDYDYLWDD